jgi:hypothetical protein
VSVPEALVPTAQTSSELTAVTPFRKLLVRLGVEIIVQLDPS